MSEVHPGSWRLWDATMGVQVLDAEGKLVCFVEDASTAHRIAAVPDLLVALEAFQEAHIRTFHSDVVTGTPACNLIRMSAAAIAKAKGETT